MAVGDAIFVDPFTFRKHFKNIGRAYREQATTLIEICRLYVDTYPQTYTVNDELQNIFRLADAALSAAGRARKGTTAEATDAFVRVQEEIKQFGRSPQKGKGTPVTGSHRKQLFDPITALESASEKDEKSMSTVSRVKSVFKAPIPSGSTKKVNFVIVESLPHKERDNQLIIHQEIDNSTTTKEIVWKFNRYPERNDDRNILGITPKAASKQNPHFYLHLSKDPASFHSEFHKDPLKDFAHGLRTGDTIYVLLDKSCHLFLDAAKPHVFGNLWKPHRTVILKDISGDLDSEDKVLRKIGESQDYWHRSSRSSQHPAQSSYSDSDSGIVEQPVGNGRALVDAALRSQNVDLMIRDRSRPEPSADSGWKPLPSQGQIVRVRLPEDQTTPRQSAPPLPRPEYPILNPSAPSAGGSTQFTASTESSRTTVNTSGAVLPRPATPVGKRTQPVDSGIGPHMELPVPSAEILIPPSSAPLADSKAPLSPSPADLGWKPLPSPGHIVRVQATLRQPALPLPRPEYPILNAGAPRIGGSTQFATPTESSRAPVITPGTTSLPRAATPVGKRTQPTDIGVGLRTELPLPTAGTSIPPSSAPLVNPTIPSPLPGPGRELPSAPPVQKEKRKNWFQKHIFDYSR
ncbi:hypothetical protein EDB87DRAFT_1258271 [Lactarius vividus]|nr:hypothetical protein EDB87DRAFT_1258271 [Lactarius vividus]